MALQIKAPEAIRLAEELSRRTGKSADDVVESALREKFDRLQDEDAEAQLRAEIYAIVHELAGYFREAPELVTDIDELLYDENGLPK